MNEGKREKENREKQELKEITLFLLVDMDFVCICF